jgi:hypothetical protein
MIKVLIKGQQVDLMGGEEIATTHAVSDIGDINNRNGIYSNTFALPKTTNNDAIFDNCRVHNSASRLPYLLLECTVIDSGVEFNGFARLESVGDEYELYFLSGNADFYKAIEGKMLSDLNLSDLNHVWNRATIAASFLKNEGYTYPLIDYSADSPNTYIDNDSIYIDSRQLLPGVYLKTLVDRIISEAGFTKEGAIFNMPLYNQLVIPKTDFELGVNTPQWVSDREIIVTSNGQTFETPSPEKVKFTNRVKDIFNFWDLSGATSTSPPFALDNFLFMYGENFAGSIEVYLEIEGMSAFIDLYEDNGNFNERILIKREQITAPVNSITINHDFSHALGSAKRYYVIIDRYDTFGVFKVNYGTFKITNVPNTKRFTHNLLASDFVEKLSQSEVITQVMLMFGLVPIFNQRKRHIKFIPFKEIIANKSKAVDWTNKLDLSSSPKTTFKPSYAQINGFKYKEDSSVNAELSKADFLISNQNLEANKDAINLPLSYSETVLRMINKRMVQIKILEAGASKQKANPRIVRINKRVITVALFERNKDNSSNYTGSFPLTGLNEISPKELIDNYYLELINVLNNYQEVTALLRLDAADISQLNFEIPIYIAPINENFGGFYYLNEISQFKHTSKESTEVKLIRI